MRPAQGNILAESATLSDAVRIIEANSSKIALVAAADRRLLGTVTDGDIRRGLLRALTLDSPIRMVMNSDPLFGRPDDTDEILRGTMTTAKIRYLPVVDGSRRIVGLAALDDLVGQRETPENWVVLMAGGLGTRLMPITGDTPKPLLNVGNKPLLQTILESFVALDFHRFYISVNYRADMIKSHFGDGSRWDSEIRYLEEDRKLGTAGALGLIPERPAEPMIVMNGDVLTKVNFRTLLDFHAEHSADATMCVREYDFQVPYGVVRLDGHTVVGIEEKPVQSFFVNAGIYALEPGMLDLIRPGEALDMTDMFQRVIDTSRGAAVFPIREYWIDVGRLDDFKRANSEFPENFG